MGVIEKIQGAGQAASEKIKGSTVSVLTLVLRVLSGFFLGLTLSLVGQEIIQYGSFGLISIILVTLGLFMKATHSWTLGKLFIFDLICILVGQILKMYIYLAP